jgi:hypothetical protein
MRVISILDAILLLMMAAIFVVALWLQPAFEATLKDMRQGVQLLEKELRK